MPKYGPKEGKGTEAVVSNEPKCNFCGNRTLQLVKISHVEKCQTCGTEISSDQSFPFITREALEKAVKESKKE